MDSSSASGRWQSTHGPEDPSRGQRSEAVFVGPMGAGKSTLAVLLAARLGLPRVAVDSLSGAYYRTLGYDEAYVRRTIGEDFRAVMEYRKPSRRGWSSGSSRSTPTALSTSV